jgi:hypothetical protein
MSNQPICLVIVDPNDRFGNSLRNTLPEREIIAYLFHAYPPALALMKSGGVDVVVMQYDVDPETVGFLTAAKELGVPVVYTDAPRSRFNGRAALFRHLHSELLP